MASKLNGLTDPIARIICGGLDPASLGLLASTNKRFHTLAPLIDSDAGKIQTFVQKCHLDDLGLRDRSLGIQKTAKREWYALCCVKNVAYLNGSFPLSLDIKKERIVSGSAGHFFIQRALQFEIRDLQGELVWTFATPEPVLQAFELPSQSGKLQVVLLKNKQLEVWDIGQKEASVQIVMHLLPGSSDSYEHPAVQFENSLVLYRTRIEGPRDNELYLFVYDLAHLENPPYRVTYSQDHLYLGLHKTTEDRVIIYSKNEGLLSFVPPKENEKAHFSWKLNKSADGADYFMCGNKKWVVAEPLIEREGSISTITTGSKVLDAQTGAICKEFPIPYLPKGDDSIPAADRQATLWGESILVEWHEDTLYFQSLPQGDLLLTHKLKGRVNEVISCDKQLIVSYRNSDTQEMHILSWNTPPRSKEISLCDRICSCVQALFDWLASFLRSLWN